jgi:hypothetical protein
VVGAVMDFIFESSWWPELRATLSILPFLFLAQFIGEKRSWGYGRKGLFIVITALAFGLVVGFFS